MKNKKAFTLLEILLVVAAIAILAGIVILAVNPTKQLGDTRNSQRRIDVNTILNAVYQYAIDNNGTLPAAIQSTTTWGICKSSPTATTSCTDLSVLTTNEKYLVSIPTDPSGVVSTNDSNYRIIRTANNRVTVWAPAAEQSATISVTR
jgi:type IV pilus assembly protein PilA